MEQEFLKLEINIPVKMRDGVVLRADIWRPDIPGRLPAILVRLPYNKTLMFGSTPGGYMNFQRFARAGYAVVIQDCRGTGSSDGEFYPWRDDTVDGYDTIEWIAAQPWCSGNVGMMGFSALAGTQWDAAMVHPPHLKAISPACMIRGVPFLDNGAYMIRVVFQWFLGMCGNALRRSALPPDKLKSLQERFAAVSDNFDEQLWYLPLKDTPATEIAKELGLHPFYTEFFTHLEDADFWRGYNCPVLLEEIKVPALHMTGWYDPPIGGVLASYIGMLSQGGSELARNNQKLLIGPWIHGGVVPPDGAIMGFGSSAAGDITGMHQRWFDYWLKGMANKVTEEPRVRLFIMGTNTWRDENEWPLARTKYTGYYFHSGGNANSLSGNGSLSTEIPAEEPPDIYLYDPRNVPMVYERGPVEQSYLETRADVLVYTTPPLEEDLEVTGPVVIKLFASSTAPDTDFMGKLLDVFPDGRSYNLNAITGMVRARYRNGELKTSLIKPGKVYEYTIDLKAVGNVFKAGHRIRVQLSSSAFPTWDRNLNTGHALGQDAEIRVAVQTILHDSGYPSHIVLPVIPA
jgi:uncharacterized protein